MLNSGYEDEAAEDTDSESVSIGDVLRTLDPAYFGFVMSTGIIAIAFRELDIGIVAQALSAFNIACYVVLLGLFGLRGVLVPERVLADLRDRERHWGTLTFIVATNTVGIQFLSFYNAARIATGVWLTAAVLTPLLLYYLFATEIVGARKVAVSERIDGAFLLVIVCMQSLAILGGLLSEFLAKFAGLLVLVSLSYFGSGYILYFVVVTIVTYRLLDGGVRREDWTGPYWITMGAAAITTLAGTTLGPRLSGFPIWEAYTPVILGLTFLALAIASWWIPLLLVLDVWKFLPTNVEGRPPLWIMICPWSRLGLGRRLHTYSPTAWGRVFPMGMYTACTLNLAGVSTFGLIRVIPAYWGWFALLVWALTFIGLLRAVGRVVLTRPGSMLRGNDVH